MRRYWHNPHAHYELENNPLVENRALLQLADEYVAAAGFPPVQKTKYARPDEEELRRIAILFNDAPDAPEDMFVRQCYALFIDEIKAQYDVYTQAFSVEYYDDNDPVPYKTSKEMANDVSENQRLQVYTGGEDHSILTRDENVMFRVVHDLQHAAYGYSFSASGEFNAFVAHSKLFSPLARRALTSETVAQNAWVNYFENHERLPPQERPYAEQKACILPLWVSRPKVLVEAYRDFPGWI